MLQKLFVSVLLATTVFAFPGFEILPREDTKGGWGGVEIPDPKVDWKKHEWRAPGPNDTRGPCPAMNTLANHGFINRNGRNVTVQDVYRGALDAFNMHSSTLNFAKITLLMVPAYQPDNFAIDDFKVHGIVEHDASLSREDFNLGDYIHFNETIFATLRDSNPGKDYYDVASAGAVMEARLKDTFARNKGVITNSKTNHDIRLLESAFYLSIMGDPTLGRANKEIVQDFFRNERLPRQLGWERTPNQITVPRLFNLTDAIAAHDPTWSPSGFNSQCDTKGITFPFPLP